MVVLEKELVVVLELEGAELVVGVDVAVLGEVFRAVVTVLV